MSHVSTRLGLGLGLGSPLRNKGYNKNKKLNNENIYALLIGADYKLCFKLGSFVLLKIGAAQLLQIGAAITS